MALNQLPGEVEFTHQWYRALLTQLRKDAEFSTFTDPLTDGDVVLRHDIDLSVDKAVQMAHLESDMEIQSTYFVLVSSPLYNPLDREHAAMIREIESLGHEIGLHFDTHTYWETKPSTRSILKRIREEQSTLSALTESSPTTVSFHRPPDWVLNRQFPGFQSAYATEYVNEINYVADSSQRWRDEQPEIESNEPMQLVVHPGLWGESDDTFGRRVERGIIETCRHANRRATREFIELNDDQDEREVETAPCRSEPRGGE